MKTLAYELSQLFFSITFQPEEDVEPLLVADHTSSGSPHRLFLVRYVVGEGTGGEGGRPIFKNELTGYDYEQQIAYPTQKKTQLDRLQSLLESFVYGSIRTRLSHVEIEIQDIRKSP